MKFGLKNKTIEKINAVFAKYLSIEKVIIYGSRAKGNYKTGSDIDITLIGNQITHDDWLRIENEIDELLTPYTFDISIFSDIENPELIEHIQRVGKIFYKR